VVDIVKMNADIVSQLEVIVAPCINMVLRYDVDDEPECVQEVSDLIQTIVK